MPLRPRRGGRLNRLGRVLATSAAVVLLAGSACTKDEDGAKPGGSKTPTVFRAGVVRPTSLDPARARSIDELLLVDQLFDSLTVADPETLEPVPSIAESFVATPDQLHWDFTLRSSARFSDGTPITSADVKATLDRIARKDSDSSVADLLESVTGYKEVAIDGAAGELTGVVATAPNVVRIDLDVPLSVLPAILANPAFGVLPKGAADANALSEPLVGSGPYRVSSQSTDRISMVAVAGTVVKSKRLDFLLFDDKAAAFDAFVANLVDWSEVPADRVGEAGKRFGKTLFRPYLAELFYAFNLRNPKFADVRFREAVVRAVDRKSIIAEVYDDTVEPMDGLVVDGLSGHQDDPCGGRCGFDPDRAKALLAEIVAGGGAVPEIQIDFDDDKTQVGVAEAIRDDLAAVGVTATLRPKPLAEYQQFAVTGEQELFRLGWILPYPSADGVLSPLFLTGFPNNLTGFSSAVVDERLQAARAEPDLARRVEHFKAAEQTVMAELPIVPIAQFVVHSVASPRVKGLRVTAGGTFDGRAVFLGPER